MIRLVPILVAATLALAGCTASPAASEDASLPPTPAVTTAPPSPTPSPSDSPTPPPAADPASPGTWTIGFTAIGPVAVGQTREEALAATAAFPQAPLADCPAPINTIDLGGAQIWLTNDVLTAVILRPGASAPDAAALPRTAEGITVGSTADQVTAAYPSAQQSQMGLSTVYSVGDGAGHWINIQELDGVVNTIVVSSFPQVPKEYCG